MNSEQRYNAVKGVQDIFPPEIFLWQKIEALSRGVFSVYGFQEIRPPIIEPTDLFIRSIGETTDIVEKEMYTFPDKAGRSITLRPEGTASVVRAYVEHHLHQLPSPQKFYYSGPMFRYERPQKGRLRQFYQIGVEAFGVAAPALDIEILSLLNDLLERIGLREIVFEINSIGCDVCRPSYREALLGFFLQRLGDFCPDCKRRYEINPLRILDCKVERCIALRAGAPAVPDSHCKQCADHFGEIRSGLDALDISYTVNPDMVRGLDYYTRTIFEVTSEHLGSQKAVAAGGRYDALVESFGGPQTPAVGFALGMERIVTLLSEQGEQAPPSSDIFIVTLGEKAALEGLRLARYLREQGLWVEVGYNASLKSQLRRADRLLSRYALIIGDNELSEGKIIWKDLKDGSQGSVELKAVKEFISSVCCDRLTKLKEAQ